MGLVESEQLTKNVNLQSFSSPYSPQFFLNKNDFKGQSINQVMKEYLNTDIKNNNENQLNDMNKKETKKDNIIKEKTINTILKSDNENNIIKTSIPSLSTLDEDTKNMFTSTNDISMQQKKK